MQQEKPNNTPCTCKMMKMWYQHVSLARAEMFSENWNEAVAQYAYASNCAEALLKTPSDTNLDYYLRTHMEFIYAIRKSAYPIIIDNLLVLVRHRVQLYLAHNSSDRPFLNLITPLADIAYSPLSEVEHWMLVMRAMDESKNLTRH